MTSPQQRIAALMEDATGIGSPAPLPRAPAGSGTEVQDGRANRPVTQLRGCSAADCTNNVGGDTCSLTAIAVNDHGGCDDYEAAADADERRDRDTIDGIGDATPARPDLPINYDPNQR